jgi:hypothetical protein
MDVSRAWTEQVMPVPFPVELTHAHLKARQRAERVQFAEAYDQTGLGLRIHRALSWLERAESLGREGDTDGQFIFLWIAFNAAYGKDLAHESEISEQQAFGLFIHMILKLDTARNRIAHLVRNEFAHSISKLLSNKFVFPDYWRARRGMISGEAFLTTFDRAQREAYLAQTAGETETILRHVLARVYTLRNQLVHGGATWKSTLNRDQVEDATALMVKLVPLIITIMMDNPASPWAIPAYPVQDE